MWEIRQALSIIHQEVNVFQKIIEETMLPQKYQKETISLAIKGTWIKPKVHSAIYGVLFCFIFVGVAMIKHWPKIA